MHAKSVLITLFAIAVMLSVPLIPSAYAYSSSVTTTGSIEAEYTTVDIFHDGASVGTIITGDISYSSEKKAYLRGEISDGLDLKFVGNSTDSFVIMVTVNSTESVLQGKDVTFTIAGRELVVPVNSSCVLTSQVFVPTEEGVSIPITATLPQMSSSTSKTQLDLGEVSFTMVRVTAVGGDGKPVSYASEGSTVISTTNTITVDIVDIKSSDDVKKVIDEVNNTVTTPDGNIAIQGNTAKGDDTLYKIIPDAENDKSVLISYDGKKDENITDGGKDVHLIIKVPANIKFYLVATVEGTLSSGMENDLKFTIGDMEPVTATGGIIGVHYTRYIVADKTVEGVTTAIKVDRGLNNQWIYSGPEGMEISIDGKRYSDNRDLELHLFMDNA